MFFVFTAFWPCIWFFAVPLLVALHDQPLKNRLGLGILFGACAYGLMARGLIGVSPAGFFVFILGLSLQGVIFSLFFKVLRDIFGQILFISTALGVQ